MIAQSTNITDLAHIGRLMITRTNNVSSPISLQVKASGEHFITVFPIRKSGMATPYQTRMVVDPVTTTTVSSKYRFKVTYRMLLAY